MRFWIVPLLAICLVLGIDSTGEPSEDQMRVAFEGSLAAQVRSALEFARETGGDEAVTKIRESGMDRYVVNAFHKRSCRAQGDGAAHICEFAIDVGLVNGPLQRTMTGRFSRHPNGFAFHDGV